MKHCLFLVSCFLFLVSNGQDKRTVDSLYTVSNGTNDTSKVNALNELSLLFCETDNQKALELAIRSCDVSKKIKDEKFLAFALNRLGSVYDYKNMPDSAYFFYNEALKRFEKLKNISGVAAVYQNIGVLYFIQEDFDQALNYYKKALELRIQTKEEKYISKLYNNIGVVLRRQKKYNEAIDYYEAALEMKLQRNDKLGVAASYQNLAMAYEYKNDVPKAEEYFNKAIALYTELNDYADLSSVYSGFADLKTYMKDYKKAGEYAELAIEYATKSELPDRMFSAYEISWTIDTLNNNYPVALRKLYAARAIRNKIFRNEKMKDVEKLKMIYETDKKDNEILLLNIENETKNRQRIYLVIIIVSVTLLFLTALFFYQRTRNANLLLSRQKKEIEDKTVQLQLQAEEIAKHRSQMNPHFIFNALNSLQGLILNNEPEISITHLNSLSKLMRQTLNNSESEWISLSSEIDYLNNYIDFELQRFDSKFDFIVKLDSEVDPENTGIAPMLIQPLIENCLKHAGLNSRENAKIKLEIKKTGNKLRISVEDNGFGRKSTNSDHQSRATGILNKRIAEVNKKLGTESSAGLKFVDLKDNQGNPVGTRCEFEIGIFELF
ncbi:MAG: hypothetical protein K0S32_878 [Bacteroidetes bacterium]|jgi:Tfp pilus assembly protein PilF|nr:hypothetical protein [Bacteroidota bacterium]